MCDHTWSIFIHKSVCEVQLKKQKLMVLVPVVLVPVIHEWQEGKTVSYTSELSLTTASLHSHFQQREKTSGRDCYFKRRCMGKVYSMYLLLEPIEREENINSWVITKVYCIVLSSDPFKIYIYNQGNLFDVN